MVLSNKKLKQKIRETLSKALVSSESQKSHHQIATATTTNNNDSAITPQQNHRQSFKSLLDSLTQKPRLSKREIKRVKIQPLQETPTNDGGSNGESMEIEENGVGSKGVGEGQKREKKRKRESKEEGVEEDKEGKKVEEKKKSNKKKQKKKKMEKGENVVEVKKEVGISQSGIDEQVVAAPETINANVCNEKEDISTKVYVGGIPYYSTEDDIRSFFEGCGTITEIDCLYFPETGKFKGIAMISFKTEAAAKRALALDGSDMGGLFLKIQPYKAAKDTKVSDFAPAIMEGYNRIYIGNLSWDITEDELKKLFSDCSISSIRLGKDKETGEFRGFAHVDFANSLSLTIALKLDQQIVCGRPVRIRCAVPPKSTNPNSKPMLTSKKPDDLKLVPNSKKAEDFTPMLSSKKAEGTNYVAPADVDAEDNVGSDISGKVKRRTCYECGQKGHLSSACPTSKKAELSKPEDTRYVAPTNVYAEDNVASDISGKIKRRTCYECGEKGHLSSACPTSKKAELSKPEDMRSVAPTNVYAEDNVASDISGKIKRRTCYECGEKGHLSSDCPASKKAESSKPAFSSNKAEDMVRMPTYKRADDIKPVPSTNNNVEDNSTLSGKIRRRTCYECGEKGHLSSACPKKLASDATITSDSIPVVSTKDGGHTMSEGHLPPKGLAYYYSTITSESMPVASSKNAVDTKSVAPTNLNAEDNAATPVSGKIRRRTCYECGEKGHLSSACPKKLASDATITSDSIPVVSTKEGGHTMSEGHLPPKGLAFFYSTIISESMPVASSKNAVDTKSVAPTNLNAEDNAATSVSGKIRRRTCYECGEKGHLSSACPKK